MPYPIQNITITAEILKFIADIDEFKGRWKVIETLAPEKLTSYSQALSPQKRAAQSKVVSMIRPKAKLSIPSVYLDVEGESDVTA